MNVEEMAYSMSGSVEVSESVFPEELSGEGIELVAACSFREDSRSEGNVSFHDEGEVTAFLRGRFTEGHGAGNVRSAVKILSAGVNEEESFRLDFRG